LSLLVLPVYLSRLVGLTKGTRQEESKKKLCVIKRNKIDFVVSKLVPYMENIVQ